MRFLSKSQQETKKIASTIAKRVVEKSNSGIVVALEGELGVGKTTFVKGFASSLGIKKTITSPTFILFRKYKTNLTKINFLYHIDAYRIKSPRELQILGIVEIFKIPKTITIIEWSENIKKLLPKNTIKICFKHGKNKNERLISYTL